MESFWDTSWEAIDPNRLIPYIKEFDMESDALLEYLNAQHVRTVCDAGCGCGVYSLKLASRGFEVSGFDVSSHAVKIARDLVEHAACKADLKTASILATGYPENHFDGVVSRDVVDHMSKEDGKAAIRELYRITKPGGIVLITLDHSDPEYEAEPHIVTNDGDYLFTDGKWKGMIFHPYREQEILSNLPSGATWRLNDAEGEWILKLEKLV